MSTPSGSGATPDDREIATSAFAEPDVRPSRLPATTAGDRSLVTVASAVASDVSQLVQAHVELAKIEMSASAKAAAKAGGMFGGAAVLGYFSVFMFLVAAAEGLASLGLWRWLSYLFVGLFLVLVAAVLGLIGKKSLDGVGGLDRTKASWETSKNYVSAEVQGARKDKG